MSNFDSSAYVPFEIAVLAAEHGFKEPCHMAYDRIEMLCTHCKSVTEPLNYNTGGNYTSVPTCDELVNWFEKKHCVFIQPLLCAKRKPEYGWYFALTYKTENGIDFDCTDSTLQSTTRYGAIIEAFFEAFKIIDSQSV